MTRQNLPNNPLVSSSTKRKQRFSIFVGSSLLLPWSALGFVAPNTRTTPIRSLRQLESPIFVVADDRAPVIDTGNAHDGEVHSYQSFNEKLMKMALETSKDTTIAEQALRLVDRMQEEEECVLPDAHIYSTLINILAFSKHPDVLKQAESVYSQMVDEDDKVPQPTVEIYCSFLELYTQHCGSERCQEFVDSLPPNVATQTPICNKLIQAYGKHGEYTKAMEIFESMEEHDTKSWVQLLRAHRHSDYTARQKLWARVPEKERSLATYNAYLQAAGSPDEADTLFYELLSKTLQPDETTLLFMLRSYRKGAPCFKVQQLLIHYDVNDLSDKTRSAALLALKQSTSSDLSLDVIQSLCRRQDSNKDVKLQRLALECCKKLGGNAAHKQDAFQWALELYNNSNNREVLHGPFLSCVNRLLPPSPKRDTVARTVFERAQKDGRVNAFVLKQFLATASEATQMQVFGGFWDEIGYIPQGWRRNVKEKTARK